MMIYHASLLLKRAYTRGLFHKEHQSLQSTLIMNLKLKFEWVENSY